MDYINNLEPLLNSRFQCVGFHSPWFNPHHMPTDVDHDHQVEPIAIADKVLKVRFVTVTATTKTRAMCNKFN